MNFFLIPKTISIKNLFHIYISTKELFYEFVNNFYTSKYFAINSIKKFWNYFLGVIISENVHFNILLDHKLWRKELFFKIVETKKFQTFT